LKNIHFSCHDKVYHELGLETLENIYEELLALKEEAISNDHPIEHSLIIIDDFANDLKEQRFSTKNK